MTQEYVSSTGTKWAVGAIIAILAVTLVFGWVTIVQERSRTETLAADNRELKQSLDKLRAELEAVSRLKTTQIAPIAPVEEETKVSLALPATAPVEIRKNGTKRKARTQAPRPSASKPDPRVDQLQTKLADHEKELASTREQLDQTRRELEDRLGSTHDELSGSIARTNEELQELRRRGERNYYEFDLFKTKEFKRVGPLGLSLRKADTKRRSYQVKLRLDDQELEKKNVNLFEPILLSTPDSPQPLQLVVNEISKDRIRGYVSEMKVKQPAVARSESPSPALQTRQ